MEEQETTDPRQRALEVMEFDGMSPTQSITLIPKGFTAYDIEYYYRACTIVDNHIVGKGVLGNKLVGIIVWISTQEYDDGEPEFCAMRFSGIFKVKYSGVPPAVSEPVTLKGDGSVLGKKELLASSLYWHSLAQWSGIVLSVDTEFNTLELIL